jgi:hypothetical protein
MCLGAAWVAFSLPFVLPLGCSSDAGTAFDPIDARPE